MLILGETSVNAAHAREWARSKRSAPVFRALADLYWRYAPERGVVPEIAYTQAAKETGWGRFGGVLDQGFRNPCGLKVRSGGQNDDEAAHARFPTWHVGVIAHLDHLALYAGAPGYPRPGSPDPRHFPSLLGQAATVADLGGRWAPAAGYGRGVVLLVRELQAL